MGELGKAFAGAKREEIAARLLRAFADEWFAHYNFRVAADRLRGHYAPEVVRLLRTESDASLRRADRLSARLREIGGEPPAKLLEAAEHPTDKPFKLPRSMSDLAGVLRAVLDAERTSARTYRDLHSLAGADDPLTAALALAFLGEAVAQEEAIERLIGDAAPGMDGR